MANCNASAPQLICEQNIYQNISCKYFMANARVFGLHGELVQEKPIALWIQARHYL